MSHKLLRQYICVRKSLTTRLSTRRLTLTLKSNECLSLDVVPNMCRAGVVVVVVYFCLTVLTLCLAKSK